MTREILAATLEEIALLLELAGEGIFKIRAYLNAAEAVRAFQGDVVSCAKENQLKGTKGIGDAIREKLHILSTTGSLPYLQELRSQFPAGLFELFKLQGLGAKKIRVLHQKLQIDSVETLRNACLEGRVSKLSGFGEKTQTAILQAIESHSTHAGQHLMGMTTSVANYILGLLRMHPETGRISITGSYRRNKETLHDLDFLVATHEPALVCQDFCQIEGVESILACGPTKASIRFQGGLQCDLRAVSPQQFPFALQYFTGSKEHNIALRARALSMGLSLNEYGFTTVQDEVRMPEGIEEEADLYRALGLSYIEPELRENRGEIEAAAVGPMDRLIQLENLRGTFHNHTTESDGHHTLEEMVEAAIELGLQYLGIADHSRSMGFANGLSEKRLIAQIESIQELNRRHTNFRVFAGSEVDILADGSLDYPDDLLAKLDYCVASVHQRMNLAEDAMTRRICRAMENEHVTMIGHLTGRILLHRAPYAVDHIKIIDCAAATNTVIELNCNPQRLDMDWRWWKYARDKGVLCSINPDAHHVDGLHNLGIGVRIARKGWLRRNDVLNTMDVDRMSIFLATPKSRRSSWIPNPANQSTDGHL